MPQDRATSGQQRAHESKARDAARHALQLEAFGQLSGVDDLDLDVVVMADQATR